MPTTASLSAPCFRPPERLKPNHADPSALQLARIKWPACTFDRDHLCVYASGWIELSRDIAVSLLDNFEPSSSSFLRIVIWTHNASFYGFTFIFQFGELQFLLSWRWLVNNLYLIAVLDASENCVLKVLRKWLQPWITKQLNGFRNWRVFRNVSDISCFFFSRLWFLVRNMRSKLND